MTPARAQPAAASPRPAVSGWVATPAARASSRTILVVGDSLSAEYGLRRGTGWVALLVDRLEDQRSPYAVVNASVSGETTTGGRARFADLLERHRPAIVVVELGGNDALRGLDLGLTERNLREMVGMARAVGARPVLVGMKVPPNYGRSYTERFAAIFERVARAERASLVPFMLEGVGGRADDFQPDRIHPSERAQARILENVWPALARLL